MKPGEIYWVEIPTANGHEQAGLRPAIILQSARFTPKLTTVQIVPLTSRIKARRFPATLVIGPDPLNHLSARSVALVFQLRAIDRRRLQAKLGTLNAAQLTRIKGLVRELFEL